MNRNDNTEDEWMKNRIECRCMNLLCIVFMQINVDNSIYNSVYIYTYVCYKVSDIKHSLNFDTILDTKDLHKIIYIMYNNAELCCNSLQSEASWIKTVERGFLKKKKNHKYDSCLAFQGLKKQKKRDKNMQIKSVEHLNVTIKYIIKFIAN